MTRRLLCVLCVLAAAVVSATATIGDAAALQARIDACGPAGCAIDIGPGDFTLEQPVTVPTRVELRGVGPASAFHVAGNFCGFAYTGSQSAIRSISLDAVTPQQSGGGICYHAGDWNIATTDILFGHNLATGVDVAPAQDNRGVYTLRNLRWNGVLASGTAVRIGDGVHHVSDVLVDGMSGTADTPAAMDVWVDVLPDTDTIDLHRLTLIKGWTGVRVGYGGPPAAVTGFSLTDSPAIETMTDYGVSIVSAQNARLHNVSVAQSRGGLAIHGGVRGLTAGDLTLHYNQGDGVTVFAGAQHVTVRDSTIADNNISGSPWGFGISLGAGLSDFTLSGNRIGNAILWGAGSMRYCIFLPPGPSKNYSIVGNSCRGATVGKIADGGTGTPKVVTGNF